MKNTPRKKTALLFFSVLAMVASSFALALWYQQDNGQRVRYLLTSHTGEQVSQQYFAGRHQLVFFGFTHCAYICPTQMSKLARVINQLEESGHADHITPTFISIDPERDTPEKVAVFVASFHKRFVGLTGSRTALESTAKSFKMFLQEAPEQRQEGYQLTHSAVVYVVDPFSRIVEVIPFETGVDSMTARLQQLL
ncbi:SCO family protein [Porticoccus sp. GXU_MW_L64]